MQQPLLAVVVGLAAYVGLLFITTVITQEDQALLIQLAEWMPGGRSIARLWKR